MDLLKIACAKLGAASDQVLVHRIEDGELVLILDRGIAGCPKYYIPLIDLQPEPEPELEQDSGTEPKPVNEPKRGRPRKTRAAGET